MGLSIIPHATFAPLPWKNGGGTTYEAIRLPPTGDPFLWRVSLAQIDSSGPFSDFTGYDRNMVLLRGGGLHSSSMTVSIEHCGKSAIGCNLTAVCPSTVSCSTVHAWT